MRNRARYEPFYNEYESKPLCKAPFQNIAYSTVSLPFFAFIFCVIYSLINDFENSTFTHCNVYNLLPSISAAIGSYTPQREVWQIAIGLHAIPRFLVAMMYLKYNREVLYPWAFSFATLACMFNVIENISLVVLSYWTSSENYPVHKTAFMTFIITSELYMLLTWTLHRRCRRNIASVAEAKSLKWKKRLLMINLICFSIAGYFFNRHNNYCEDYVYTFFAFFEYIVVLSNMAFHMTAYWDFKDRDLVITFSSISLEYR